MLSEFQRTLEPAGRGAVGRALQRARAALPRRGRELPASAGSGEEAMRQLRCSRAPCGAALLGRWPHARVALRACEFRQRPLRPTSSSRTRTSSRWILQQPRATALAVRDGKFIAVGDDAAVATRARRRDARIDAGGRTLIPGLNDSHLHAVRGGRFYNLELRWDGVDSLERALAMIREQAKRTPKGQWVRVIGGWSPYQFKEKRMPTVAELNEAAPDTPTFVLFLYSQGLHQPRCGAGARSHAARRRRRTAGATSSSMAARSCMPSRTR